ncbi:ATP-binding protein [Kitasatospora mediocidica]|uniref:ATP-binding protein n=1 Tax=Kitasatospora mediocidica TaxID=58352 RepID=UPI00068D6437|nr:ATP-binding protein [Kitasatospora mediocidica]
MAPPDDATTNHVGAGVFLSAVVQGRDLRVRLPAQVHPALSGLPAATAAFTGRSAELTALLDALAPDVDCDPTVVVLSGLAGIGKTALALQAADTARRRGWFPAGVLYTDLRGHHDEPPLRSADVLGGHLRALGVPGDRIPPGITDRAQLMSTVVAAFHRERRTLLVVLDDAGGHDQLLPLLPTGPGTRTIITSRFPLPHLPGVPPRHRLLLDPLDPEDSARLLHLAVTLADPHDTRVADQPRHATRLTQLCGGHPLALRTAAAQLAENPARPLSALADDLTDPGTRLEELSQPAATLRIGFDRSYRQLTADQARLYRLLPLTPTPSVSVAAAAALLGTDQRTAHRLLRELAHLLEPPRDDQPYWTMHSLVRLHADEHGRRTAETDGRAAAHARLLAHYRATAEAIEQP